MGEEISRNKPCPQRPSQVPRQSTGDSWGLLKAHLLLHLFLNPLVFYPHSLYTLFYTSVVMFYHRWRSGKESASQCRRWKRHRFNPLVRNIFQFPLKEEMATHSSILAWKVPWTEEPGWQRVGHNWAHSACQLFGFIFYGLCQYPSPRLPW